MGKSDLGDSTMTKAILVAAAIAGGLMFATLAPQPAAALPMVKADMAKSGSGMMLVRRGGHGGGHHRSFGGGGHHRSFGGGGRHRSFGGGGRHRSFGGYGGGGGRHYRRSHRSHAGRRHHGRFRSYYLPYVPSYYYDDYGYTDDGCGWLRLKALRTGSGYWWRRYDACINGY
jgi:hypothetical protein